MSPDDLSPEDREIAQMAILRIWLARKRPPAPEGRRASDQAIPVKAA